MKTRNLILTLVFAAIVIVELLGRLIDNINLEYIAKPLIMIWIAVFFLLNAQKKSFKVPVLLAFFFSWVGDMFLMFSGGYDNEMFFFAGVGGFFFAQCMYVYLFLKFTEENNRGRAELMTNRGRAELMTKGSKGSKGSKKGFLIRSPFMFIPLVGFLVGFYLLLLPGLEGLMKTIILVYAISLIGMSLAALNRKGRVGKAEFRWVFLGSLFFVISDSMIALNKFYFEDGFPLSGFWIMLTYIAAQYLIMRGLILEKQSNP